MFKFIRVQLEKDLFGSIFRRKPLLSKNNNNIAVKLSAKLQVNKLQDFWNNVLRTDDSKMEMFGHDTQNQI